MCHNKNRSLNDYCCVFIQECSEISSFKAHVRSTFSFTNQKKKGDKKNYDFQLVLIVIIFCLGLFCVLESRHETIEVRKDNRNRSAWNKNKIVSMAQNKNILLFETVIVSINWLASASIVVVAHT